MKSMKLPFLEKEICFAHQQTNDVSDGHMGHTILHGYHCRHCCPRLFVRLNDIFSSSDENLDKH